MQDDLPLLVGILIAILTIRFVLWPALRGTLEDPPSQQEVSNFARRGAPTDGWGPSILIWACIAGVVSVLAALIYYNCQTSVGANWVPWVQDRTPYLLMVGIVICIVGAFASRTRSSS
jgi:hypothetical protein